MADCPQFWQSRKVEINLLNMKDEEYMDNIQLSAIVAIALDLLVGIGSFIFIWRTTGLRTMWRNSRFELCGFTLCRGFRNLKFFIMKIVLGFGMPLWNTALGKGKLY